MATSRTRRPAAKLGEQPTANVATDEPSVVEGTLVGKVVDDAPVDTTDTATDGDEPRMIGTTVPFHGRMIAVTIPSPEQLMVMQRLARRYAPEGGGQAQLQDAQAVIRGYDRAVKAITSVIVDSDDVDFIEDLLLERKIDLAAAGQLLHQAMQALQQANQEQMTRHEKRAAAAKTRGRGKAKLATTG